MSRINLKLLGFFSFSIFLLASIISSFAAKCGICSRNYACITSNTFQYCQNGKPTIGSYSCPENYVCMNTQNDAICSKNTTNIKPICPDCYQCDANKVFACTGTRSFAMCLGTSTPSTTNNGTCGSNEVCVISSANICVTLNETVTPTCGNFSLPSPINNPNGYCRVRQQALNYAVDNNGRCKTYVKCFLYDGAWRGQLYECPGSTFFNQATYSCGTTWPSNCSS